MINKKITENVNWLEMRVAAGLTLGQLAELSGYSVATINGLELHGNGSRRLKDKLASVLLSRAEGGISVEVQHWRDRAIQAERKLDDLRNAMLAWLKKF
ncbi:MAG: helix-turn-helix transcriptional regulator [Verrucomicrobiae bacterium]